MSRNLDSMASNRDDILDCEEEDEEEELDPRVQEELEKLNKHTDQINKLETQLEEANGLFRTLLSDSTHQLKAMSQKVGTSSFFLLSWNPRDRDRPKKFCSFCFIVDTLGNFHIFFCSHDHEKFNLYRLFYSSKYFNFDPFGNRNFQKLPNFKWYSNNFHHFVSTNFPLIFVYFLP